jgi:hypothetical protein
MTTNSAMGAFTAKILRFQLDKGVAAIQAHLHLPFHLASLLSQNDLRREKQ